MAQNGAKLGYGKASNIDTAIKNKVLDVHDLVITSDTSEFMYVKDDSTTQTVRSRNRCFDSIVDATEALNASTDTYAGQIVMIKDSDDEYEIYTVQQNAAGTWEVKALPTTSSTGIPWVMF